jgi:hypothetical protein
LPPYLSLKVYPFINSISPLNPVSSSNSRFAAISIVSLTPSSISNLPPKPFHVCGSKTTSDLKPTKNLLVFSQKGTIPAPIVPQRIF